MSEVAFYYSGRDGRTIVALLPEELRWYSVRRPEAFGRSVAIAARLRGPGSGFGLEVNDDPLLYATVSGYVIYDDYPSNGLTSADVVASLGYRVGNPGYCLIEDADYPLRRSQWLPADETAIGPEGTVDEVEAIAWLVAA